MEMCCHLVKTSQCIVGRVIRLSSFSQTAAGEAECYLSVFIFSAVEWGRVAALSNVTTPLMIGVITVVCTLSTFNNIPAHGHVFTAFSQWEDAIYMHLMLKMT